MSLIGGPGLFDFDEKILKQPDLHKEALEELLRRYTTSNMARVTVADMEYGSVQLKAGDAVFLPLTAASLDDRRYADPFTVDFGRADKRSLVFGRGPHQCIGAFLARTGLRVFLHEWLKRFPDFEIAPGKHISAIVGTDNALRSLPIVWKVA